jgi:hypothetical protein
MKKIFFIGTAVFLLTSCGGASDEQSKAAKEMCNCMDKAEFGDFDIDYYECELEIQEKFSGEIVSDNGWVDALEEECPTVAAQLTEAE